MFRTISVQQLEYLLDGERTFTLLDVREQREYEAGHLLGAVNLPYERLDEVEAEIPKDRPAPTGARACLRRGSLQGAGMTR
jgi:rhodanese-related sulfurtransferase